ncbi:hypothetical protein GCM10011386_37210 [Parapedobacter defluvii]|uniref:Ankyrin repeat n=1 Tax=Parapedobacter defluvii TaxID=2045106 RepID=A0ABQ1MRD6_9SPHI|nr:ankyrin repeat domain-containing protein [Parapedobacter defluvii]GGC41636.1 hypothetical protein GCM10011386_37210 [Parapedobacter defluvii]
MTNEELRAIESAARQSDAATVEMIINGASTATDYPSYQANSVVAQLIRSGFYHALDQLIDKGVLLPTDLFEYDGFDTSVVSVLVKPQLGSDEAWDGYLSWFGGYLNRLDDIEEEVGSTTLLEYALTANAPLPLLKVITAAGADPVRSDSYGRTLLYKACGLRMNSPQRTAELLDWLLGEGADPNEATVEGKTALHAAIVAGKMEAVARLLEHGADPNIADKKGETAFHYAAVGQHNPVILEMLLARQTPDFHAVTQQGENLLNAYLRVMYADTESARKIVSLLLAAGADLTEASSWYSNAKTGVDWVAEKSADLLAQVVENGHLGADYRDNEGNTLLHKVCRVDLNYEEAKAKELYRKVKFLLKQGVDPRIENTEDKKAVDYAIDDNLKAKTVELLLKHDN